MKFKLIAAGMVVGMMAAGASSCSSGTVAQRTSEPCSTDQGNGTWIEDDNSFWEETHVTVRLCVNEAGKILDLEVE